MIKKYRYVQSCGWKNKVDIFGRFLNKPLFMGARLQWITIMKDRYEDMAGKNKADGLLLKYFSF